jgi:hypothetical protein
LKTRRAGGAVAVAGVCVAFGLAAAAAAVGGSSNADAHVRAIMGEIVMSLQTLLPLSLDGQLFADPDRRAEIEAALDKLAENAERLSTHGSQRESSFDFLSRSLADDSRDIRKRFAGGYVEESRFLLQQLTDTCIACHSRLPDDRPHPLGQRLLDHPTIAQLPREQRVRLEAAMRQFDRAMSSYESLFADPATSLAEIDLTGHFESYLELCLRVQRDPTRALSNLKLLLARDDLPQRLRGSIGGWARSLRSLDTRSDGTPIARARALMVPEDPKAPADAQLVRLIAASGILHRYLAGAGSSDEPAVGEAYYLLGVIESRMGRSFWVSQSEPLLEAAIRHAPAESYAQDAFALLEELVVSGFTGSSGTHIPPDVVQQMDELQQLLDAADR